MTEATENTSPTAPSRLDTLKERADHMGITYHPSIGADALSKKINDAMDGVKEKQPFPARDSLIPAIAPAASEVKAAESESQMRLRKKNEAERLVRVQLTCMNPAKKEWDNEIFTVSNALVGSLKRCVPFNVPWHIPQMMLNMIRERDCQIFYTHTDSKGNKGRKGKLIKEFGIQELPALTVAEYDDLARRQAMAAGTAA